MPKLDTLARYFWSRVEVGPTNACWLWIGARTCAVNIFNDKAGKYTTKPAAHVALYLTTGHWPEKGKTFRPVECGQRFCMNVRHYRELTPKQLRRRKRWEDRRKPELPPQRMPAT